MTTYKAKYFDGTTPEAHAVEVGVKNAVLEITKNGAILDHWPLKLIYRDKTHITKVVLACQGDDDARLELIETAILKDIEIKNPLSGKIAFKVSSKEILLMVGGIVAILFLIFLGIKPLTRFAAKNISHETERTLLKQLTEFAKPPVCTLTMEQSFALENLLARVYPLSEEDKDLGLRVQILDSPQVNAYALPGAEIWILKGLLKEAQSPEELAGILAHEIEHVKQRHVLETMVRATLFTSFLSIAAGDVSGVLLVDPHTAMSVLSLSFDREMEARADAGALERLRTAEISSDGIIQFFERNNEKGVKLPGFMSSHPLDEARIQKFKLEGIVEKKSPVLSEKEWVNLKKSCD